LKLQKLNFILLYYIKTKEMAKILDFIQSNGMVKVLLAVIAIVVLYLYMKTTFFENLDNITGLESSKEYTELLAELPSPPPPPAAEVVKEQQAMAQPSVFQQQPEEQQQVSTNQQQAQIDNIVAGTTKLQAEDLLPKYNDANEFAKENPVSKLLKEQNFLISGYHVGINTVMQSNKIPYHDIRSLPPIPKESVGPWNQSSFEQSPAQLRRQFEIGV